MGKGPGELTRLRAALESDAILPALGAFLNNWDRSEIYNFVFGLRPRFRKDGGSPVSSSN